MIGTFYLASEGVFMPETTLQAQAPAPLTTLTEDEILFRDNIRQFAEDKLRPLVREMQVGGLLHDEMRGARAELVKAVNDMRKNGEPLDLEEKHRILGFCYDPGVTDQAELAESLSAVSEDEAWKTYLWLGDAQNDGSASTQSLNRDFIYANLLEISGKQKEALEKYRSLQQDPQTKRFMFKDRVDDAVKRLSKG